MTVPSSMLGPPLGGVLFVAAAPLPFAVDAVSYLVSGAVVLSLRGQVRTPARTEPALPLRAALGEGLRFLWGSQVLRTLCLLLAVFNAMSAAVLGVLVLFVQQVLGLSERGYGVLLVVFAVGALLGMSVSTRLRRRLTTSGVVSLVLGLQAVAMLAIGLLSTVTVTAVGFAVAGATSGLWNVATISLRQRIVPDALLGRAASAYGLPATFIVAGVGLAAALLAALRWLPRSVVEEAEAAALPR